tara:strand:- start:98 stop:340 length:243 start_codon:yes stop_codon:yes gene_type:complete
MIYILTVKEEIMAKERAQKYKDAQVLLSRATNKTQTLLFTEKDNYEQAEQDLLDKAVSKLHEAQSLILKARLRMKNEERI